MAEENLEELGRAAQRARDEIQAFGSVTAKTQRELDRLRDKQSRAAKAAELLGRATLSTASAVSAATKEITALGKSAAGVAAGFAKSANQVSGNLEQLNPVIDLTTKAISSLAKSIPLVGGALGGAATAVGEAGKILIAQLQVTAKAFQDISQVGGLTARGMSGLRDQFIRSGLSLESYRRAVEANSKSLAVFRSTVGDGAESFATALNGLTQDRTLRNIGFTADTIAEGAATFLEQQAKLGRSRDLTERQLAYSTREYLSELDKLARVTGANRKDLQKQQLAALSEQRFRASLLELQGTEQGRLLAQQAQNLQSVIADRAPQIAQGFRDLFASGGVASSEASKKLAVLTGNAAQDIVRRFRAGQIDADQAFQELTMSVKGGVDAFGNIAKFADLSGKIGDYAQAADLAALAGKNLAESQKIATKTQTQNKEATDSLTRGVVDTQINLEKFNIEINKLFIDLLPTASTMLTNFTNVMLDSIKKLSEIATKSPQEIAQAAKNTTLDSIKAGALGFIDGMTLGFGKAAAEKLGSNAFSQAEAAAPVAYGAGKIGSIVVPGAAAAKAVGAAGRVAGTTLAPNAGAIGKTLGAGVNKLIAGASGLAAAGAALLFGPAAGPASGIVDTVKNSMKPGAEAGGPSPEKSLAVAKKLEENLKGFKQITAINDGYYRGPHSKHNKGEAIDFTVVNPPRNEKESQAMIAEIKKILGSNVKVKDEYNDPSPHATGGHFHVEGYRDGGISRGPETGYFQKLHGTEAVVPLPDGKNIPVDIRGILGDFNSGQNNQQQLDLMQRQIDRLEQLVTLTERSISNDGASAQVRKLQDLIDLMTNSNNINQKMLRVARN